MSRSLIRVAGSVFLVLCAARPTAAQPANDLQLGGAPRSGAEFAVRGGADDENQESDLRILATTRVSTMERELNEAAAQGFRLKVVGDDIDSGEGLVDEIFALVLGNSRLDRFSYRLVALKDLGTTEEERARALTSAAAEGFRFRGLVQAPLGRHAVLVLEHDADTEAARLEYLVLATVRLATLERELAEAAGLGYRVMAITMHGAGAFDSNDRIAILTRPHPEDAPAMPAPAR